MQGLTQDSGRRANNWTWALTSGLLHDNVLWLYELEEDSVGGFYNGLHTLPILCTYKQINIYIYIHIRRCVYTYWLRKGCTTQGR